MAYNSLIQWTNATWNIITGCSAISPGCTNCYAMKLAGTRLKHHHSRADLTQMTKGGPVWTGEVRFNEEWLTQPLRWKRPRKIFVCAHGDLFHENVPFEWIDRVFAVMALSPQHTFQVLTKRADRMREYLASAYRLGYVFGASKLLPHQHKYADRREQWPYRRQNWQWPLPNVWIGVSAEDQTRWDERVAHLRETPAATRWVSVEPMLGPIHDSQDMAGIDWVVAGGESGRRPRNPDFDFHAAALLRQCKDSGTAFFGKQGFGGGDINPSLDIKEFPA